jgi:hypothetical protein
MMDAVEKRVLDRITVERKSLQGAQMKLGKTRATALKDATKARKAVEALFTALEGDGPTARVAATGTDALAALPKIARTLMGLNDKIATNAQMLATLEDPKERDRRVKQAKELGGDDATLTGVEAAELVLIRRGKAMHVTDITREVMETGIVKLKGATPHQTMSAYMSREVAKPNGKFVRLDPGFFDLRARAEAQNAEPVVA